MYKFLLSIALVLQPVFVPVAMAYFTPEETLVNQPILRISNRERDELILKQNQERIARLKNAGSSSSATEVVDDGGIHAAPGEDPSTTDEDVVRLEVDAATVRLLERVLRNREVQTQVLHAGAPLDEMPVQHIPLTSSGPEGPLTVLMMLSAVGWTLWKARNVKTLNSKY